MQATPTENGTGIVDASTARRAVPHIVEFDGLRGFLAWWVVLFHLIQWSGLSRLNNKLLGVTIGQGWGAVPIFFILSGFVIALMGESRKEPYSSFLIRRFFRLAPVYYLSIALGIVDALRAHTYPGSTLAAHVGLHVAMLHGLAPEQVLPGSAHALDYVAWSITVEWQFYLVAPFVLTMVKRSATAAMGLMIAFGLVTYAMSHGPYSFASGATVFQYAGAFTVGIASFHLFRRVMEHPAAYRPFAAYMLPAGLALCWMCGGPLIWPGPIWVVLFSAVLAYHAGVETWVTRPIRVLLGLPFSAWLGRLSYSTYLCHNRVLVLVDEAAGRFVEPSIGSRTLVMVLIGMPMIVGASAALHYLIELPSISLGKRLAGRLDRRLAGRSGVGAGS